ncbi:MAG: hypothetical protein ABL994_23060, partial [Verrucomicrobiales bacterium]
LGRLSFSSLGMARGEITVEQSSPLDEGSEGGNPSRVVAVLSELVSAMLQINQRKSPATRILIGSIEAGSGYSVPPRSGLVRFEIRSLDAGRVARIEREIVALVENFSGRAGVSSRIEMIAHRQPGDLGSKHPLVREARETLEALGIESRVEPSVSELASLLEKRIPSLTLGVTRGENRHSPQESIYLDPIFDGLAQLVSVLQFMDTGDFSF